jgi:hypothetical protein
MNPYKSKLFVVMAFGRRDKKLVFVRVLSIASKPLFLYYFSLEGVSWFAAPTCAGVGWAANTRSIADAEWLFSVLMLLDGAAALSGLLRCIGSRRKASTVNKIIQIKRNPSRVQSKTAWVIVIGTAASMWYVLFPSLPCSLAARSF